LGRAAAYECRNLPQFASIRDPISNLNNFPRLAVSPSAYRALRSKAMIVWRETAELGIAAWRQGKAPYVRTIAVRRIDSAGAGDPR
jgi:hypothetical protein